MNNNSPRLPKSFKAGATLTMYTIYFEPDGYPGLYVVQLWTVSHIKAEMGDDPIYVGPSLSAARRSIPSDAGFLLIRDVNDDPAIVESWF